MYITDTWGGTHGAPMCDVLPVQNVDRDLPDVMLQSKMLKRWPFMVQKIVIEQE